MHYCPDCDEACGCDMEDHFQEAPLDCRHDCRPDDDDDWIEADPEFFGGRSVINRDAIE